MCYISTVTSLSSFNFQGAQGPAGPSGPAGARGMPVCIFINIETYTYTCLNNFWPVQTKGKTELELDEIVKLQ